MGRDHWAHRFPWAWWYEKLPKSGRPCSQLRGEGLACHWPMSLCWGSHIFPAKAKDAPPPSFGFPSLRERLRWQQWLAKAAATTGPVLPPVPGPKLPLDIAVAGTVGAHHLHFSSWLTSRVLFTVTLHARVAGGQGRGGLKTYRPLRGTLWVTGPRLRSHYKAEGKLG